MKKSIITLYLISIYELCVFGIPIDSSGAFVVSSTPTSKHGEKEGSTSNSRTISTMPKIYQMHVSSRVTNRFVRTMVVSKLKNEAPKSQEAMFSIVIPDTAFISKFVMEINGKNYTAYVKEKEEAKKAYDAAVADGQGAAHVAISARDSNRFTVFVNIEPETKAAFYLKYEELLNRRDSHYELVLSLHPGQFVEDLSVEVMISESRKMLDLRALPLRSGNEIANEKIELDPRAAIKVIDDKNAIVTFTPNLQRQKQLTNLLGTTESEGLSAQFVVQYDVERDPSGGEVLLQEGYFVHFFAPTDLKPLPKHVVFILDTSSSMYGEKMEQLQEAMVKILEQLNEQDKFNLVQFNTNIKVWDLFENDRSVWFPGKSTSTNLNREEEPDVSRVTFPEAYHVNSDTINKAKEAISTLTPTASTDIYNALKVGLYLIELSKRKESNHQPMIIFLTDGDPTVRVTSTESIIRKITEFNSGPRKTAIFTLSFGNDADKHFLKNIALRNLGFSRHIYEGADGSLQLQNFYRQISSPLLTNVTFKYAPSTTSLTKTDFPIHFKGSEIVIAGFCGTPDFVPPTIDGRSEHGWIRLTPRIMHSITSTERLWAYLTVKQLLEIKEISDKEQEKLKKKALELSLKYKFVTSVSSLVVVKPNATVTLQPEAADKSGLGIVDVGIAHHYSLAPAASNDIFLMQSGPYSHERTLTSHDAYANADTRDTFFNIPATNDLPIFIKSDIFSSLPWLKDIHNEGLLRLTKGKFKLGLNETVNEKNDCPKTPYNEAGYCALLNECKQVFSALTSKDVFEEHLCILGRAEYAGVCCPDLP